MVRYRPTNATVKLTQLMDSMEMESEDRISRYERQTGKPYRLKRQWHEAGFGDQRASLRQNHFARLRHGCAASPNSRPRPALNGCGRTWATTTRAPGKSSRGCS